MQGLCCFMTISQHVTGFIACAAIRSFSHIVRCLVRKGKTELISAELSIHQIVGKVACF